MPDFEAIGDAATGAVLGGTVEPKTGGADGRTHEKNCLNCGAELIGDYCHACGQRAHVHRSLGAFFHDLLHGVFHFEGKIWATLPMLVWKPGELTRAYIDGQRARYVSPVALFLFSVFLMFAIVSVTGIADMPATHVKADIAKQVDTHEAVAKRLEAERAAAERAGRSTVSVDQRIAQNQRELDGLKKLQETGIQGSSVQVAEGTPGWLRAAILQAARNPELLIYKLKTNAYKFSWALIPISAPFVWLLFPFSRRFRMYDHTVFVTYSLCFMLLLLVTATVIGLAAPAIEDLAWLVPPFHMYRQLRGTYGVGRWGGIWRAAALSIFAFIAISLFVSLLVTVGAFD
jgi:hypothetical protein